VTKLPRRPDFNVSPPENCPDCPNRSGQGALAHDPEKVEPGFQKKIMLKQKARTG
jgi:hypothetical protein